VVNFTLELDGDCDYFNARPPTLLDHGLVTKVGSASNSGLYELTDAGEATLAYRNQYIELSPGCVRRCHRRRRGFAPVWPPGHTLDSILLPVII